MAEYTKPWLSNAIEQELKALTEWVRKNKNAKREGEAVDNALLRSQTEADDKDGERFECNGRTFKIRNVTGRSRWVYTSEVSIFRFITCMFLTCLQAHTPLVALAQTTMLYRRFNCECLGSLQQED